ncbi:hypothetical protein AgCh_023945 [Apium graveolens]
MRVRLDYLKCFSINLPTLSLYQICSLNVHDGNTIIMAAKRHTTKNVNKKKNMNPGRNESEERKLKKLQENKEKEILISESIATLEKYKIGDVAQSLMWTSKNLVQVETFQAKRKREVQFSKAGLRLPTHNHPVKRKTNDNTSAFESQPKRLHLSENCDISSLTCSLVGDREVMQDGSSICGILGDVGQCEAPVRFKEISDENSEIPLPLNQQNVSPHSVFTAPKVDKPMYLVKEPDNMKQDRIHECQAGHLSSISSLANVHPGGARTAPIIVHVSRPPEIESTRKDLPIVMMEQEIMEAINENTSVIICGETGCGKTTQVPQNDFLLKKYSVIILDEAYVRSLNTDILIGMLSRIILERKRIYEEQKNQEILLNNRTSPENKVYPLKLVLMSATLRIEDFVCGRRIFSEPPPVIEVPARQYPVKEYFIKRTESVDYVGQAYKKVFLIHKNLPPGGIIVFVTGQREVDEAFEIEEDLSPRRSDRFGSYNDGYDDMPEDESDASFDFDKDSDLEVSGKDMDVFAGNTLESDIPPVSPMCVLPLYAMVPACAQLRVFNKAKDGERLVVVATNVAETSLTIPGTKYVVDTGKEKVKVYDSANGMETYNVQWISKASAAQRAGRAGRTWPGHCYRLYSFAALEKFQKFSSAEISKIPVDGVVLLLKSMGIDKVVNFPFPTPPELSAINEAEGCLKVLEALDTNGRLTPLGKAMVHYPITAAALTLSNPFITQFEGNHDEKSDTAASEKFIDNEEKLRKKKLEESSRASCAKFCNPASDILSTAYALQCFELSNNPMKFCTEYALHLKTMEEMSKLRKQLLKLVFQQSGDSIKDFTWTRGEMVDVESSWKDLSEEKHLSMYEEELLGQAICAGWVDRVAKKIRAYSDKDRNLNADRYQTCTNETVILHRRSSLSRSCPEFLVYSELVNTKRPSIYGATTVKPEWLVRYGNSMCTFSAPKFYYEHLSDLVLCQMTPIYVRCQWSLPLHSFPVKDNRQRVAVFACSLIGGAVLPCLKSVRNFLAAKPATILRPPAGHKRVENLLIKLKTSIKTIDSCAVLKEVWSENPVELYPEILDWFQKRFHNQFQELWAEFTARFS